MPKKVFFSLGDRSADRILSKILPHLEGDFELYGMGGRYTENLLQKVGNVEDITATGLFEVLPKLGRIVATKRRVLDFLKREKPHALVAVDAPGFNLPLIKRARELGIRRVVYYILPQIWAWKEGRKYTLARYSDSLISILPFEERYFSDLKVDFVYAGHPSVELLKDIPNEKPLREDYFVVFPGSRTSEVRRHLKVLEKAIPLAVKEFSLRPVVLAFRSHRRFLRKLHSLCRVVYIDANPERGHLFIKHARFGWIKSGTTAFETALLGTPHLLFYRVSRPTYWIAKRLVKTPHLHLANVILGEGVIPELVQDRFTPEGLIKATYRLLEEPEYWREHFSVLREKLRPPKGSVFEYTAEVLKEKIG